MERLGAQDLSMVLPDDFGWPQDIGALGILDGSRLLEPDGRFPIEAVREQIGRRLHLLPRFRQLLYTPPRGLGWPLWVDAPAFNIADHVGVVPRGAGSPYLTGVPPIRPPAARPVLIPPPSLRRPGRRPAPGDLP
jgi:diacylglycerol O-acyltransferase / wax synthase